MIVAEPRAAPPGASRADGRLELHLERIGAVTRPRRCYAAPPLQCSRVRYDEPDAPGRAVFTLLHLGGILGGDRYELLVEAGEGTAATVAAAAATQVYAMPAGEAELRTTLRLGPGSRLAWLGAPLILCAGSRLRQSTRVELAPGATLTLLEVLAMGRVARGEMCRFEQYESRLEVRGSGERLLAVERTRLEPGRQDPLAPGMLAGASILGSLYLLGAEVDAERICRAVAARGDTTQGATVLPNNCGVLVRALGSSASKVHRSLLALAVELCPR